MLRGLAAALILCLAATSAAWADDDLGAAWSTLARSQWQPVARLHIYRHWRGSYDIMFYRSEDADGAPRWMASLQIWWDRELHDVAWVGCPAITEAAAYLDRFSESDLDPLDPGALPVVSDMGGIGLSFPRGPGAEVSYYQPCCVTSRFDQWAARTAASVAPCFGPWQGYMP